MAGNSLSIPGLMSGLSTADIIAKMMDVEKLPLTSMQNKKDQAQQRLDAFRDIRTRFSSLLTAIQNLNKRSSIDAKSVTADTPTGSPTLVTATASADAALGAFTLKVRSLATATTASSYGAGGPEAIGGAVQAGQPLASAGFSTTPTTGTFTVNGAQITIDASTVLSDGVDAVGANTIFAKIRDATAALGDPNKAVTVSWGLDDNGRQNKLVLTASGTIQLGSGSDTSNFLTAAGLAAVPPAASMTSARNLGGVKASAYLNSAEANLDITLTAATGSFKINGVEISYDGNVDSLNNIISRINSSAANVTATFDSASDRVTLTAKTTGASLISLEDVTGNFLAATKLSAAHETVGNNAVYRLNGEAVDRYSTSNTVTDAVTGVTLNFKKADDATWITLNVNQDTSSTVAAVKDFVSQYNSAMSLIRDKTAYDATKKEGGLLMGDATVLGIERTMASLLNGSGVGLSSVARSLSDIGITTGKVGTAVGQTDNLVLDESKLVAKLQSNAAAVADVFGGLVNTTALTPGGTGSIASVAGTPNKRSSGSYSIVSDASGNLTATFTPSGGGAPVVTTGTILAGGTNSTLIPGVTLTAKGVLAAGTDTVTTNFTTVGVGVSIADYLSNLTKSGGIFDVAQESGNSEIADINSSIQRLQDRLDQREANLRMKFNALELALSNLQNQSSSLSAQLAQLSS